jgi:DNA-binding beta-propeller fold protein YncE
MADVRRLLGLVVACCLVGVLLWLVLSSGDGSSDMGYGSTSSDVLWGGSWSLAFPSAQKIDGDQQAADLKLTRRAGFGTLVARERSRTEFAHLGIVRAARVARDAFPEMITHSVGGLPLLGAGERVVRYVSSHAAQLELPGGKRVVVESSQPMAIKASHGRDMPVDLGLIKVGDDYESVRPIVGALIGQRAGEGVELPEAGVSLTPVNAKGVALNSSDGVVDGASVFYANTQPDTDMAVKPTSEGVETSTILRSVNSAKQFYFRVGLAYGEDLVQSHVANGSGPINVVSGGKVIAFIRPPIATDAEGTSVPVSMSVQGGLLTMSVSVNSGEYRWPVMVDPEIVEKVDEGFQTGECNGCSNWRWYASPESSFKHEWYNASLKLSGVYPLSAGNYAGMAYHTQGESKVYRLEAETSGWNFKRSEARLELAEKRGVEEGAVEASAQIARKTGETGPAFWEHQANSVSSGGHPGNVAAFKVEALETSPETNIEASMGRAWVYLEQESSPTVSLNESEAVIDNGRANVLYKSSNSSEWLSPTQGAFEVKAHDAGLGVDSWEVAVGYWLLVEQPYRESKCNGAQCNPEARSFITYNPDMPEGERTLEWMAENFADNGECLFNGKCRGSKITRTIKVDAKPPSKLEVNGWSVGGEVSAAPHTLTVSATDEAPEGQHSSGVKSVGVSVDGGSESIVSGASCSLGTCTGSGQYALYAEGLSEGVHRLVVTATDNAGNQASKEFTFDVRHASPVSIGPGTVDPTTGQFKLSATDVSLAGAGGVSRVYESRNLSAGVLGPLGPQWAISLGGGESLTVLPSGGVSVVSDNGGRITFWPNGKGEFESPKGDENLKMEYKAAEHRYVLKDEAAATETIFEQPKGTEETPPTFANQFGAESSVLNRPVSEAIDPNGNVWVTDWVDDRIAKFSPSGILLAVYGAYGSEAGQMLNPWGIAINQKTGNVYVTDYGNNRIDEFSSSGNFIEAMGWGVSNGTAEYEICSSSCRAGIAGSGSGQFNALEGVSVDSSGNIWVVDYGNDRVEKFNEEGHYQLQFGSPGSGSGQFNGPLDVAFAGGNVYVTDQSNNRIDEFSTSGSFIKAIGWGVGSGKEELETCTSSCRSGISGSGNGQFNLPRGLATDPASGNLYVTEVGGNRVQEITTSGVFVTKFGSAGSGTGQFARPMGVVVSSSEEIYVTDFENARIQEWGRQTWWPTSAKGSLSKGATFLYQAVAGAEGTTIQPSEVLSPTPTGISCGTKPEELKEEKDKGCRALTFKYATATTTKGEGESEWGEYKGRLGQVIFHAYNTTTKTMEEKAVAQYTYDGRGRLRAEWDPRIEASTSCGKSCPALKTIFGYDAEGHVTALTPPGQESWAFTYGTTANDPSTGRLLKVIRARASESLWNGEPPSLGEKLPPHGPKLSGYPEVGIKMGVSQGTWGNGPVAYGYQWEDCNSKGQECAPILGATNGNYTPTSGDVGHTLMAQVTATNGGGSAVALSEASTMVVSNVAGSYSQTVDSGNSLNAVSCIPSTTECVMSDSAGKAFYATNVSSSSAASWNSWNGPSGDSPSQALDCTTSSQCLLADGKESAGGKLFSATRLGGPWEEVSNPAYGVDTIPCASSSLCVAGQDGAGYFRYSINPKSSSWVIENQGTAAMKSGFCLPSPFCAFADSVGNVHIATSASQIESSSWTETVVQHQVSLNGIACASTTSCIVIAGAGNYAGYVFNLTIESGGTAYSSKHDIDGSNELTGTTCTSSSTCVIVDSVGNVFISKSGGAEWTEVYSFHDHLSGVSCASAALCAAVDKEGKVVTFSPSNQSTEGSPGETVAPEQGSTVEYHIPVSGSTAPYSLSKEEVEKWGQKDSSESEDNDPVEGMAIFPADEPQGWPASDYKRATIDYMNEKGLSVNIASPTGGIMTKEYNELNETVRSLSADDRATALKEGCESVKEHKCKSAEASEKLDTKTAYNPSGNDIMKVLGPEHKVKLSTGEEIEARSATHDYYNEGAREAEEKTKNSITS